MCKRWLWLWPSDPPREKTRAKAYAERVISNLKPNLPVYTHPTEGQVCKEHLVNRRRDGTVCESLCQCSVYLRGFKLNDVIFLEIWDVVSIWGQELEVYVVVVFFESQQKRPDERKRGVKRPFLGIAPGWWAACWLPPLGCGMLFCGNPCAICCGARLPHTQKWLDFDLMLVAMSKMQFAKSSGDIWVSPRKPGET